MVLIQFWLACEVRAIHLRRPNKLGITTRHRNFQLVLGDVLYGVDWRSIIIFTKVRNVIDRCFLIVEFCEELLELLMSFHHSVVNAITVLGYEIHRLSLSVLNT